MEHIGIPFEEDGENRIITAHGYSIRNMLAGECGIHLYYGYNSVLIPIHFYFTDKTTHKNYDIIRIYDDRKIPGTITDLRTTLSNAMDITPEEFNLVLRAG